MTALFLLATLLPYVCAARVLRGQPDRALIPKDRRRFEALILGTGGLSGILHVLLFTGRLSIPAVAAAGSAGVGLAWARRRGGPLSVTGQAPDGGDWLQASRRAGIMFGRLLGPHFLAWGAAIVWLVAESAAVLLRRRPDPVAAARLWFVCLMALVAGVHVAGLVGAPWTSLELTGGGSLRYLLPFWVLYAFLAFVGLFSRLLPWHRVAALRTAAWLLLAAGATWQAAARHGAGGLNPGTDFLASLVATAALIAAAAAALPPDRSPSQPRSRALLLARAAIVVLAGAALWLRAWQAAPPGTRQRRSARTYTSRMSARRRSRSIHAVVACSRRCCWSAAVTSARASSKLSCRPFRTNRVACLA